VGAAFPEEFNQFVFANEFSLLPRIYFFHHAFQFATSCDLPKLNYKSSSHAEFRIQSLAINAR
jgi:hypothetical protein